MSVSVSQSLLGGGDSDFVVKLFGEFECFFAELNVNLLLNVTGWEPGDAGLVGDPVLGDCAEILRFATGAMSLSQQARHVIKPRL